MQQIETFQLIIDASHNRGDNLTGPYCSIHIPINRNVSGSTYFLLFIYHVPYGVGDRGSLQLSFP